jgi:hypothetical protein
VKSPQSTHVAGGVTHVPGYNGNVGSWRRYMGGKDTVLGSAVPINDQEAPGVWQGGKSAQATKHLVQKYHQRPRKRRPSGRHPRQAMSPSAMLSTSKSRVKPQSQAARPPCAQQDKEGNLIAAGG